MYHTEKPPLASMLHTGSGLIPFHTDSVECI